MSSHDNLDSCFYPFGKSDICNLQKIVNTFLVDSDKEITFYNTTDGCLELILSKRHNVKSIIKDDHLYMDFWKCIVEDVNYFSKVLVSIFSNFDPKHVDDFVGLMGTALDKYVKSAFLYIVKNCCVQNENGSHDLHDSFRPQEVIENMIKIKDIEIDNVTFYKTMPPNIESDLFFYINDSDNLKTCLDLCSQYDSWFLLTDLQKINLKQIKKEKILLLDERYLITKEPKKCKKCLNTLLWCT
mgnify:CR=1 FL=1